VSGSISWRCQASAIALENSDLFESLQRSNLELVVAYDATIEGWSRAMDLRDHATEGHTLRVTQTTVELARAMGLADEKLAQIRRGALLHDIGKMGIPDSILLKPGPLTDDEWVLMKRHPIMAYEMLASVGYLRSALTFPTAITRSGTEGLPRLKRMKPLAARIFVIDVWDALTSDRPPESMGRQQALDHILSRAANTSIRKWSRRFRA
jgi:putative nucleotidyltransferase with HDIG domain